MIAFSSFEYKHEADFLLYCRVLTADVHEYELLRQSWDTTNRPKYTSRQWSDEQAEALRLLEVGVSYVDESTKQESDGCISKVHPAAARRSYCSRWQYVAHL